MSSARLKKMDDESMRIALLDLYTKDHHLKYAKHLIEFLQNKDHEIMFISSEKNEKLHNFISNYPKIKLGTIYKNEPKIYKEISLTSFYIFRKTIYDLFTLSRAFNIAKRWNAEVLHLLWVDTTFLLPLYILTRKSWFFRFFVNFFPLSSYIGTKTNSRNYVYYLKRAHQFFNLFFLKTLIQKKLIKGTFICNINPEKYKEKIINRLNWVKKFQNDVYFLYDASYGDHSSICTQSEARKKLRLPDNVPILLSFGRTRKIKGLDILLEAMKMVEEKFCLLIAGEPDFITKEDIDRYKKQLHHHMIIERLNFIPEDEVPYYFVASDAIVMPYRTHYELGTSGIFMQALSAKKPIICSDIGTIGQTTRENSFGITVAPESTVSLAIGISDFLNQRDKIEEKARLSINNYLKQSDWNIVASKIENVYKK
jgi:glycosyltransferase involved in cell wall biosynthesis